MQTSKQSLTVNGEPVPDDCVAELHAADINGDIAEQLRQRGYLLLRGAHDPAEVDAARQEVLRRLSEVGEVKDPVESGLASGKSRRREVYPTPDDLGAFWQSVSEGKALRNVINGPRISGVMDILIQEPARHFSFAWLRAMTTGRASPPHIDHPYMNRGSKRLLTCWTPFCPISLSDGTLYILEGSHTWADIRQQFEGHDVDRDPSRPGHIQKNPITLAQHKSSRFLTTEFDMGDCLIFGMFTVHGSFDNNSENGLIRLSCDTRFQPSKDPMDERFRGPNPPAHNGLGYGCLSASRPLTETSISR